MTRAASRRPQRLLDEHRGRWDIPTLALLALVLLAFGVLVPALTFVNIFADDTFSVLTGIQAFFESGNAARRHRAVVRPRRTAAGDCAGRVRADRADRAVRRPRGP